MIPTWRRVGAGRLAGLALLLLAGRLTFPGGLAAQAGGKQIGDLVYVSDVDYRTGRDRSYVLAPDTAIHLGLRWRCTRHGFRLQILSAVRYLGAEPPVTYRVGDTGPIGPEPWRGGEGEWVYAPRSHLARINRRAPQADTLVLTVRGPEGRATTGRFSLRGFDRALARLPCATR